MKGVEKGRREKRNCNITIMRWPCAALTLQALVMLSVLEAKVASPSLKDV